MCRPSIENNNGKENINKTISITETTDKTALMPMVRKTLLFNIVNSTHYPLWQHVHQVLGP